MVDIQTASLIIVASMILLMTTGMPLGIVTLTVSISTALAFFGPPGLFLVASNAQGLLEAYPLVAVPLFVLMANILERAGVAEDLFDAMSLIGRRLPGGAVQTTLVSVVMAAMTGIMGGEIVMLGLIALPQMLRLGYDKHLAMGTICASGSLATLIPPSVIMIIYGLTANVSITDLFLGGFLPGLLLASLYIIYIVVRCSIQPRLAPPPSDALMGLSGKEKMAKLRSLILPGLVIVWVLGSIYGGIATVTEAAGVGARTTDVGDDARSAAQDHDHGWHHYLADTGCRQLRRHLQHHRRQRLHARVADRTRYFANGCDLRDHGHSDRAWHIHGVDRNRLHHGADLRAGGGCARL